MVWMGLVWFTHSFSTVSGHPGCFCPLARVDNAAVSMAVQESLQVPLSVLLGPFLEVDSFSSLFLELIHCALHAAPVSYVTVRGTVLIGSPVSLLLTVSSWGTGSGAWHCTPDAMDSAQSVSQ